MERYRLSDKEIEKMFSLTHKNKDGLIQQHVSYFDFNYLDSVMRNTFARKIICNWVTICKMYLLNINKIDMSDGRYFMWGFPVDIYVDEEMHDDQICLMNNEFDLIEATTFLLREFYLQN